MQQLRKRALLLPLVCLVLFAAACNRDPKIQAQRYVTNGNKFFDKGKFKEASIMYRRALQKDLRNGEAYYRLGLTELKLGSYADATRSLRRAVDLLPNNTDAPAKLADIYLVASTQESQRSEEMRMEARDLATTLLQRSPNSYDGHRIMGQLALLDKDPVTAVKEIRIAYGIDPKPELSLSLFQAYIQNTQAAEAEKLARTVIEKNKAFSPIYDELYIEYMRQKRTADAEQVMKLKSDNNPKEANYLLELATHYFVVNQRPQVEAILQRLTDESAYPGGNLLAGDFLFFRAHNFDAARGQYEAGMKANPKDKAAYQKRLVELYATEGKNPEAKQLLAAVLEQNPKDTEAVALRAALLLQTGNQEEVKQATNDLQSLVAKTPDNHVLRFNLAKAYIAKNELDQARLQLEASVKIRPDFVLARNALARIYLAKGDIGKALQQADEILKLSPGDVQGRLARSSSLLAMGDKDKARQELEIVQKVEPENPDARYQTGFLDWQSKDYKHAEQVFTDLYKSNPKDIRGLTGIIETLVSEKRFDEAVRQLQAAIAKEPNRTEFQTELALVESRSEPPRYDEAIAIYQKLLKDDPKSADILFQLAETQRRKGDINNAIDTFRRASQVNPSDTRALVQLGMLMDGTGRRDQAKPIYEQILKIEPDHPVALNNLAFIKAEEGADLDEALTMAQRARQKMPDSPDIKDTLGWIYIKKNLSDDAVRLFKELTDAQPSNPSFHYHYGLALLQKGDKPAAKREFEAAIRNNPSRDDAGKIRQLLAAN